MSSYIHTHNSLTLTLTEHCDEPQTILNVSSNIEWLDQKIRQARSKITQFTAAVKESSTKKKGTESSIHNFANKLKISIKLQTYSRELNKNIFL